MSKEKRSLKIAKSEDSLCLAVLSWLHILLISAGVYLLTTLAYDMELPEGLPSQAAKSPAGLLAESLWLLIPLALGWIFIRVTRSLLLYLLCSCAVCALLAGLSHSALTTALSVFFFAARCYVRIKKGRLNRILSETPGEAGAQLSPELWEIPTFLDRPLPAHWAVFVFYYVIFLVAKKTEFLRYVFYLLLADVFVCFLFSYLDNMRRFIRESKRIANLPVHSIQKVGRILLLVSTILLGVIVLPSALYGREPLTNLHFHRKAVELTPSTEFPELMPGIPSGADFGMPGEAPSEPPAWLVALGNVLFYLGVVAIAAAVLAAVYRICRNALAYFAQGEEDEIIFLGTEERAGTGSGKPSLRAKKERRNSPNQKIRRLYKKTIRRAMKEYADGKIQASLTRPEEAKTLAGLARAKEGRAPVNQAFLAGSGAAATPAGWETPSELEAKAKLARNESTDKLHSLYEKARYSREGCTEEEAEALR